MSLDIVYVTSISKAHVSVRKQRSAVDTGITRLFVYGINEAGKFSRKRINPLQIPIYNRRKVHRKLVTCPVCSTKFTAFYKTKSELDNLICPRCS